MSSSFLDEFASFDAPHAFWTTPNPQEPGSMIYTWKIEGWEIRSDPCIPTIRWHHVHSIIEFPKQPEHLRAKAAFLKTRYPALPDEVLGFFYEPNRVQTRSSLKMLLRASFVDAAGLSPNEQIWEAWNIIQASCPACEIQQARGLFYGGHPEVQCLEDASDSKQAFGSEDFGQWAFYARDSAPSGAYVVTDPSGSWKAANPVSLARYNEILCNAMKREIRHRFQNEEFERARVDSQHWRHSVRGVPTYFHPLVGSWTPKLPESGTESFITRLPPLWPDCHPTNPIRLPNSWLEQRREREALRRQLL